MKIFLLIAIMACALNFLPVEAKSFKWGVKGRRDVLLDVIYVIRNCAEDNPYEEDKCTEVVKFPVDGDINQKTITFIYAIDELGEEGPAEAQLISGGFGQKKAELHLKVDPGTPLNFVIEIYGKELASLRK